MHQVGAIGEELVIPGRCRDFGLRTLLFFEDKSRSILMDVEIVLDDRRQLHLERVIIDFVGLCYVRLEDSRVRSDQIAHCDLSQPKGTNDILYGEGALISVALGD